jgi:hypothetical protein
MEKRIAGFSPSDADQLRRALTHQREKQRMKQIGREFVSKAMELGCSKQVAETIFSYIEGYAGLACETSLTDDAIRQVGSLLNGCRQSAYRGTMPPPLWIFV